MAYAIEPRNEDGYVELTFFGTVTRDLLDRSMEGTYYELIRNGLHNIFVNVTQGTISMSPTELYVFVRLIKSKMLMGSSIAVLARPDQMEVLNFIENIPYNRMKFRGFTDRNMAHKWLVKNTGNFAQSIES